MQTAKRTSLCSHFKGLNRFVRNPFTDNYLQAIKHEIHTIAASKRAFRVSDKNKLGDQFGIQLFKKPTASEMKWIQDHLPEPYNRVVWIPKDNKLRVSYEGQSI